MPAEHRPLAYDVSPEEFVDLPRLQAGSGRGRGPDHHSCRVLVVDDDLFVRARLCALLHTSDYEVESAGSAEEALHTLESTHCDIVLTDWQMPEMDGVSLCRTVRSMPQDDYVYLMMLTVRQTHHDFLAGFAAGADDFVVKGTPIDEILARVEIGRRITRWRAARRPNAGLGPSMSLTDGASGAYNLTYLLQHLPRELARAQRHGHPLAVLSCEIEGLPEIARQRGPAAADVALRQFVSRTTGCVRQGDWLVRTGGNEFMIVLPETALKGAQCVTRKLGAQLAELTLNIDITAVEPYREAETDSAIRALLRRAARFEPNGTALQQSPGASSSVRYLDARSPQSQRQ